MSKFKINDVLICIDPRVIIGADGDIVKIIAIHGDLYYVEVIRDTDLGFWASKSTPLSMDNYLIDDIYEVLPGYNTELGRVIYKDIK